MKVKAAMTTKSKDLFYYLNLPYTIEVLPSTVGGWVIRIKELPGCLSQADTWADVLPMIREAQQLWLETALEFGDPIPEPTPQL